MSLLVLWFGCLLASGQEDSPEEPDFFFLTGGSYGSLTEIGVSFPVGLNSDAPDWGVIVQFQFEWASIGAN